MKTICFIIVFIILAAFWGLCPKVEATSGSMSFVIQNATSSAKTTAANLLVLKMNQGTTTIKGMAKEGGLSGDKMQTFIRDLTDNYFLTKSTTMAVTGTIYVIFQNAGTTDFKIYRDGQTTYSLCRAGTDCPEGIR
jgi:hypothetical protein